MKNWKEISQGIQRLLSKHAGVLSHDTVDAVNHYIAHDEYEMAFEGLCIDLMQASASDVDWPRCIELARELGLHEETVFDANFWSKLQNQSADAPSGTGRNG